MSQLHNNIYSSLNFLRSAIMLLPNGREKSIMLTKCDEIGHWNGDLKKEEFIGSKDI